MASSRRIQSLAQKLGVSLALAAGMLGVSSGASAYPTFPGYLQNIYSMECAPSCLLCHTDPLGGADHMKGMQLDTPVGPGRGNGVFVQNLIAHGGMALLNGDPSEADLKAALEALRTTPCDPSNAADTPCDSDGDGSIDSNELMESEDPDNSKPAASLCIGPVYGCGAHVAPAPVAKRSVEPVALLAALGVAFVLFRRRRA